MKSANKLFSALLILALFFSFLPAMPASAAADGDVIYDSIPTPLPPNKPSLGYQATQSAEFGDHVAFAGTKRNLKSVTVMMSNWALHSTYPTLPDAGFTHPITFNIYQVDNSGAVPQPGTRIASLTQSFVMPWRPEADPTCAGGTAWRASDGSCYNGYAFTITFDFSSLALTLPEEVIFGVAYNTNTWGYQPIGQPGPYESLNFALNTTAPSVGTDVNLDDVFYNTKTAGWYADHGAGGVGTFRRDTEWSGYVPAVRFEVGAAKLETSTTTPLFCTAETSKIKIDLSTVANLYGYQFEVNYDATLVSASGAFVNSFFSTTGASTPWNATCAAGKCRFSVSHVDPQTPVSGSGTVAEITFTGIKAGEFDVTIGNDILSDRDANVIGHTAAAPLHLTVCGYASASGVVSLQGRDTPKDAGKITLTGAFGPYETNFDTTTGAWSIANIKVMPAGTSYTFDASHSLYLGAQKTHTLMPVEAYAAGAVKLKGGDADNSGKIDVSDLACIAGTAFGSGPAVCGAGSTDINADLVTNILDLVLAGGNYDLATPQIWP